MFNRKRSPSATKPLPIDWQALSDEIEPISDRWFYGITTGALLVVSAILLITALHADVATTSPSDDVLLLVITLACVALAALTIVALPVYVLGVRKERTTSQIRDRTTAVQHVVDLVIAVGVATASVAFVRTHDNPEAVALTALGPVGSTILFRPALERLELILLQRVFHFRRGSPRVQVNLFGGRHRRRM